jgi:hypothetical protein
VSLGIWLVVWLGARSASAQSENAALAESLFREGRELLEAGRAPEACAKLGESYRLDARLGTLLNLAACHEMEGKLASAWAEFLDAERLARARTNASLEQTAVARAKAVEPRIPRLVLHVATEKAEVRLDGRLLSAAAWSSPIPVDPGTHVVEVARSGYVARRIELVTDNARRTTEVDVPPLVAVKPAPDKPVVVVVAKPGPENRWTRPVFLGGAVVTVLSASAATYFGIRAIDEKDARDTSCDALGCGSEGLAHQRDAMTAATTATVFVSIAAVSAAIAIVALVWPQKSRTSARY